MTSAKDLPSFFKRAYFFTHRNQHIAEFDQLRLVANGTMSRNDDVLIRNPRDICFSCADHSVNAAAGCQTSSCQQSSPGKAHHQLLMNASRSAMIVSACVVGMPCGKPL